MYALLNMLVCFVWRFSHASIARKDEVPQPSLVYEGIAYNPADLTIKDCSLYRAFALVMYNLGTCYSESSVY